MAALAPALPTARVLDLFAGSGALGLEALSRGAREVVFVERSPRVLRVLRANVERLGAGGEVRIVRADAISYLEGLARFDFDLAVADPPYRGDRPDAVVKCFQRIPFARELWIEHRAGAVPGGGGAARVRRYGGTALSTFFAGDRSGGHRREDESEEEGEDHA